MENERESTELAVTAPKKKPSKGGLNYNDLPKCTGTTRSGNRCPNVAMTGSVFCRWHIPAQEKSQLQAADMEARAVKLRSIGSMRALVLPKDIALKYETILSDPQLISLKTDIAFIETRIQTVTARISQLKESRGVVNILKKSHDQMSKDIRQGRLSFQSAFQDIGMVINRDWSTVLLWEEVYELTKRKRELVETESKRMKDLQAYLTPEQAFSIVAALVAIAREFIPQDRAEEFSERVAKVLKTSRGDYDTPVDEVITNVESYDAVVSPVETVQDDDGTFVPET